MSYQSDREEFCYYMGREGVPLDQVHRILRDANTIQRFAAERCNRELSAEEQRRDDAADQRIDSVCQEYGIGYETSGDPRGACVKLRLKTHRGNSFGGDGLYCVPTRGY